MILKIRPARIALIYAAFGVALTLSSVWIARLWFPTIPAQNSTQLIRELLFVALTSILVYYLVHHAGRRLERDRAWHLNLFERNPNPMWIMDRESLRFLAVNEAAIQQYGYTFQEFMEMKLPALFPPDEISQHRLAKAKDDYGLNKFTGWQHRLKNGNLIHVEISSQTIQFAKRSARMVMAENVSARYDSEKNATRAALELTTTLESITDGFLTLNRDWNFTYVNSEAEKLLERGRDQLLGKSMWSEFPEALGTSFERQYREAMETGVTKTFEAFFVPVNLWFSLRVYPSEAGLAIYFRDITERRQMIEALRESERQHSSLLNNLPGMAYRGYPNADRTLLFVSEGSFALTGYNPEEIVNNSVVAFGKLVVPEDRDRILLEIWQAVQEFRPFEIEYRILTRSGERKRIWERGTFFLKENSTEGILEGFVMDVTARRHAEADRERFMAAIDQLAEIVMITDPSGIIQYVNPAFELVTGYSRDEAVGQNPRILNSGIQDEAFFKDMFLTLNAGRTYRGRMVNRRKDKSLFTEDSIISPVFDAKGILVNFICTKNDITSQLQLEKHYLQAQKMEAVGRLAGGVAHDFNNMLTVILMRTELALRRTQTDDALYSTLTEIREAAERSASMTRQLLTYARKQNVEPRLVALNSTLESMLKVLRRLVGEDVELIWLPGSDLQSVKIDPVQIDQLLTNLCINARDAIHNTGKVVIETQNITLDIDYCRNRPGCIPGEYILLSVSDDGSGMDKEILAHLFEPFYTTKEVGKGTGLGLATVYGIVKQNNGFLSVYSEPENGTTFQIYLPAHRGTVSNAFKSSEPDLPRASGEIILVVEDESLILEATAEILMSLGYTVLQAGTSSQAEQFAATHPQEIHLLLTDVVMPGINGRDLAEKLRLLRPDMKCLFMSGYTANVVMNRGLADSMEIFIQKPFSTAELARKVRAALDRKVSLFKLGDASPPS